MSSFVHLHAHSTFSFLDGYGTPDQIAGRVKELGHPCCAITDHGNVMAHVPFREAMKRQGLTPIYGCEFYMVEDLHDRIRTQESLGANAFPHITILAETQKGYENLLALSRISWTEGRYYKPRIDAEHLYRHQEGLVVLSGCPGGWPTRLLVAKGADACADWLREMQQNIERFYVELDPCPGLDISEKSLGSLVEIARVLKIPTVLTADPHFPRREDHAAQDILLCVGMGKTLADEERKAKLQLPEDLYYCSDYEIYERARKTAPEVAPAVWLPALTNTRAIADRCHVDLPHAERVQFAGLKPGQTADDLLWSQASRALAKLDREGALPEGLIHRYVARALTELNVFKEKGFCDYILAVADVIQHMKAQNCVVITRGSAGGCLLLWLLGASVTDPIRHDLSFERFYDHTRSDPPDIDVDFEQARRQEAIDYVRATYGEDCCSQLAAISQLKARSAVLDVAFALGIPRSEVAPLTAVLGSEDADVDRQLSDVTEPKALAVLEKHPQLRLADKLVGQYRQPSIHAAGVVISSMPLDRVVGIMLGKSGQHVASVDKRSAAKLGLLKMDFLSVASLDVVGATVRQLGWKAEDLEKLPLDDEAALDVARRGHLAGVFQLDGAAAARVGREIGIDTFSDLVAASALCRPGPGDWVQSYANHKQDPGAFEHYLAQLFPLAAETVRSTYGILLYQEQVMALCHDLAGLDWPEVHQIRKGIGEKQPPEWWNARTAAFVGGCVQHGVPAAEAMEWWERIKAHGGYSFNRAHCVTYALIGYWMCYLKAHHPAEFYDAYLSLEDNAVTMKRLIREFRQRGGQVELLDPAASTDTFSSPRPGVLVGGWTNIHGVGSKTALKIRSKGTYTSFTDLWSKLPKALSKRLQETGIDTGEWNPQAVILMAPWFPLPDVAEGVTELRGDTGMPRLEELPRGQRGKGDLTLCGYVTATRFERDRVMWTIEDETDTVLCRIPARQVVSHGDPFRGLEVADLIAVTGWWSGDALYVKEHVVIERRPQAPPPAERGSRARPAVPEGQSDLAVLEAIAREEAK